MLRQRLQRWLCEAEAPWLTAARNEKIVVNKEMYKKDGMVEIITRLFTTVPVV